MRTKISRRRAIKIASGAAIGMSIPGLLRAQDTFPSRRVTLIVPFPPGGPTDVTARILAEKLSKALNQAVVVDNIGGASGNVGAQTAARAAPDGYTLFFGTGGTHGANPALFKTPGYDPIRSLLGQIQTDGGNLLHGTAPFHVVVATTTLWHSDAATAGPFHTSKNV